jgi:hypothetical protein
LRQALAPSREALLRYIYFSRCTAALVALGGAKLALV